MRLGALTCTCHLVILEKIGICSVSWNPPSPIVRLPDSGVMHTTGECAQYAAAIAVTKLVMPGPFCPMHTPCLPVTRE